MAKREIHFELFRRNSAKGAWVLHDVVGLREKAFEISQELIVSGNAANVKIVKHIYDTDTGDYLSLQIFEDGLTQMKVNPAAEDMPYNPPCFKPEDLYSFHARSTIARLLRDFLTLKKITVIELIHRSDMLSNLESTGTIYQHAIQKISVAQSASTSVPIHQIIKTLNGLATNAMARVYRDARRKFFPVAGPGEFAALAERLADEADGTYRFNGAIALHLASCKTWHEKLMRLFAIADERPSGDDARELLMGCVDALVAEILNGSAALQELMGENENLGEALLVLVDLVLGNAPSGGTPTEGLIALSDHFAANALPTARIAIANRIIAELKRSRRLCSTSMLDELELMRRIANRLVLADRSYMSHEAMIAAFTQRSRRLVSHESIAGYVSEAQSQDGKIEVLLRVEENIIGAENKRLLGTALEQMLSSNVFELHFLSSPVPAMARIRRLAELQAMVRQSNFKDSHRAKFSDWLDRVAHEIENRSKPLKTAYDNLPNPVERMLALLKLCQSNALTEGRMKARAHELMLTAMGQPGFLKAFLDKARRTGMIGGGDPEKAIIELVDMLDGVGIPRETGLKSIAA